jgi:hypothetical protein
MYHFFSTRCLEKFKNDPDGFLTREVPQAAAEDSDAIPVTANGPLYTRPMHPEIRQNYPGSSPKCGMALEPVEPIQAASKTEYVCPTHPQIVRFEPGNCPICGMDLRVARRERRREGVPATGRHHAALLDKHPAHDSADIDRNVGPDPGRTNSAHDARIASNVD